MISDKQLHQVQSLSCWLLRLAPVLFYLPCVRTKQYNPIDQINDLGWRSDLRKVGPQQSPNAETSDSRCGAKGQTKSQPPDALFQLNDFKIFRKPTSGKSARHEAQWIGEPPQPAVPYQGDLFLPLFVVEAKPAAMEPQVNASSAQIAPKPAPCEEMPAAINDPEIATTHPCRTDSSEAVDSRDTPDRIGGLGSAGKPEAEEAVQNCTLSPAPDSNHPAHAQGKNGHFKLHANTDAIQTLGSFEFEIYPFLLDPEKGDLFRFADDDRRKPLIRQIGTGDLAALIFAKRKATDLKLLRRLDAAELEGELDITQARELANIKKSIKAGRKSLAAKYFVEMKESNPYTHAAIAYSVFLPIEVYRRQRAHGWLYWRKGGNISRILVDVDGQDMPDPERAKVSPADLDEGKTDIVAVTGKFAEDVPVHTPQGVNP